MSPAEAPVLGAPKNFSARLHIALFGAQNIVLQLQHAGKLARGRNPQLKRKYHSRQHQLASHSFSPTASAPPPPARAPAAAPARRLPPPPPARTPVAAHGPPSAAHGPGPRSAAPQLASRLALPPPQLASRPARRQRPRSPPTPRSPPGHATTRLEGPRHQLADGSQMQEISCSTFRLEKVVEPTRS